MLLCLFLCWYIAVCQFIIKERMTMNDLFNGKDNGPEGQ